MDKNTFTEDMQDLVNVAVKNEHTPFEKIKNFDTLKVVQVLRSAYKKLATTFSRVANKIFDKYLAQLKEGTSNMQLLIDFRMMEHCASFYREEYETVCAMISEYYVYMFCGHMVDALLGKVRDDGEYSTNDDI